MKKSNFLIFCLLAILATLGFVYTQKKVYKKVNPYTGKLQNIHLSVAQEIILGKHQASIIIQQNGGLCTNKKLQNKLQKVGKRITTKSIAKKTNYTFNFYLLNNKRTLNAFALAGGKIFITKALLFKLKNEDQLASILSHEIAHVLAKHSNEKISESNFWSLLFIGDDTGKRFYKFTQKTIANNLLINRPKDEFESDELGIQLMIAAGYNPNCLIEVINILNNNTSKKGQFEQKKSHPSPLKRIEKIKRIINKLDK